MGKKIPVIIAANECSGGVTAWADQLRSALAEHPRYEVRLLYLGAERPESFDLFAATIDEARRIVCESAPVVVVPNSFWELYLAGLERGVVCIGMCHEGSEELYYNPLGWYEPAIAKFIAVSHECSSQLVARLPYRAQDIATANASMEQFGEFFVRLLDELAPEFCQADLEQRYGMFGYAHPLLKQHQTILLQEEQLSRLRRRTLSQRLRQGLRSITRKAS